MERNHDPNLGVVVVPPCAVLVDTATTGEAGGLMPWSPKRACAVPACPHYAVERGRCAAHATQARTVYRRHATGPTAYNSARWVRAARAFRARHPFCVNAQANVPGCTLIAEEVDHVRPHKGDVVAFWNEANWQPMCASCHSAKTAREVNHGM